MNISVKKIFISLLLCSVFIFACKDSDFEIYLEKGSCFGQCPTYSVKFVSDGSFTYVGKRFIAPIGEKKGTLTKEEKENLKKWVKESGVLKFSQEKIDSLNLSYDNINNTDFPSLQLEIKTDKTQKFKLKGPIPKEIVGLSKKIETLITAKLTAKE